MGSWLSLSISSLFKGVKAKIIIIGLDSSGKSTIVYKAKLGEPETTIPVIGFNIETIKYKDVSFNSWDVGGRDRIYKLYRHFYQDTNALIFVVDSNDRDRIREASEELHRVMKEDLLKDCILLVFANKQDLPNSMITTELVEKLKLEDLRQRWYIQPSCATTGEGLYEGFDWLSTQLKNK